MGDLLASIGFFLTECLFFGVFSFTIPLFHLLRICRFTWRQERVSELSFPNPTNFHMTSYPILSRALQEINYSSLQFLRGVMEAGAKTESTPHPGKPSEMELSVDGISSSCPGCVSLDS